VTSSSPPVVRPILATAALLASIDALIYLAASPARFESWYLALLPVTGKTLVTASVLALVWRIHRSAARDADAMIAARYACAVAIVAYLLHWASFLPSGLPLVVAAVAALAVYKVRARVRAAPRTAGPAQKTTRGLLWGLVGLALLSSGAVVAADALRDRRSRASCTAGHDVPRVVLIVVDTLRADALSCYGSETPTPHLDALAEDSVVFDQARSPAPWTLPAMASLMTGAAPRVHRVDDAHAALPDGWPTLAEQLRGAGYRTGAIGRNRFLVDRGFHQGFQDFDLFPRPRVEQPLGSALPFVARRALARHASTGQLVDRAIDWISAERETDFLLWLHLLDPHQPYTPPPQSLPGWTDAGRIGLSFDLLDEVRDGTFVPTDAEIERIRALYLEEVRHVDAQIGRLVQHLKELGLYDDALIVLTSDHGEELWEHGGYEHGHTLYEELLRVPLMVKHPGAARTGRDDTLTSLEDVAPAILDLCGLPAATGGVRELHFATANLYGPPLDSVHFDELKLIHDTEAGEYELYDLRSDPGEADDLAGARPEDVFHGRGILADHEVRSAAAEVQLGRSAVAIELDPGAREQLRELGYVD
jgi:choline-sulfatase